MKDERNSRRFNELRISVRISETCVMRQAEKRFIVQEKRRVGIRYSRHKYDRQDHYLLQR
jgi:hypothetical protein